MNRVRPYVLLALVLAILLVGTSYAAAQHAGSGSSAPPPPAGDGRLTVRVLHPADPTSVSGIAIALYALSADGTPGFASGETNAQGLFIFTGVSSDPGIVYLVGARFEEIPFGERVTFAAGENEARVDIEVMAPTEQTSGIAVEELRIRIDWMGDRIVLRERLLLSNSGDRVIQLPSDDRTRSIVVRRLDASASDFSPGSNSISDGLALEDSGVRFWGPLYPGEQHIEYQYSLPIPEEGRTLRVPVEISEPAARIVVVAGTAEIEIQGPRLIASGDVQSDSGAALKAWARVGLKAGERFEIDLILPESRFDPTLLSVPRGDIWLELDDTRLVATVDLQIEVEPGAPVAGSPEAPLLRILIPEGATLQGVAPEAEALGLIPKGDPSRGPSGSEGSLGFDVVGPIGPGTTSLGYSYSVPASSEGVRLRMRFPREIQTLNVLIADTGLALDSSRLHRRRPFRSGTRNYLHREAFNIAPDEIVDLSLTPLGPSGLPQSASVGLAIAAAVAGALFLFAPLRGARGPEPAEASPLEGIQAEREMIYAAIRDLDHDFETAKLVEDDYTKMRDGLRAKAIELLRTEREATSNEGISATTSGNPAVDPSGNQEPSPSRSQAAGAPYTGDYCPGCGGEVPTSWRFCSHCGDELNPAEEEKA